MSLIARVTSNGKTTNCTRYSRVLLTLPVLVMNAINISYCTSNHILIVYDRLMIKFSVTVVVITFSTAGIIRKQSIVIDSVQLLDR